MNPAIVWLATNVVALVLLVVVLGGWARPRTEVRRVALAGAVAVALAFAALAALFGREQVPIGWITVLMEGPSLRNIQQLYGQGAHFGAGFHALANLLTGNDATTLPAVVHVNVCLAVVNTIVFFLLAVGVLRSWCASLAFAVVYAGNLNTLHAAFSETPAMLWATYFWAGCVAASVIDDPSDAPPWLRRAALLCLCLLVWLAEELRVELLVIGAPALAVAAAKTFGWEPAVRRAEAALARVLRSIAAGRLPIFLLVAAGFALLEFLPWPGTETAWVIAGLRPLNLSFLGMPLWLSVFLPFAGILLFVLGMIHALRRWFTFFLLPVSTIVLFKIYASASHGVFFERFRYLTFLTPVVFFVALFGFRELADWARRWTWPSWWKRTAVFLLAMSCVGWQTAGPKEIFRRRQALPGLAHTGFLLAWNQQTETRYLLDLVARYPHCVFIAKTAQPGWLAGHRTGYQWVIFGAPTSYREIRDATGLEQVAAQSEPGASCVLYYRSLDCDLVEADGCEAETHGRVPLEERRFENLPYSDITEYGAHHPIVRLGVYPVVPAATPGPGRAPPATS